MSHIEQRRRRYYALLDVPVDVRDALGKRRFVQSLETEEKSLAQERVGSLISKWKAEIRLARAGGLPENREALVAYIKEERITYPDKGLDFYDGLVADLAEERRDPDLFSEGTGRVTKTTEYLAEYLAAQDNTPKTKDMKKSDVLRFAKEFPYFERVTNKKAKTWVRSLGVAPPTQKRIVGFISDYWRWCAEYKELKAEYCLKGTTEPHSASKKKAGRVRSHYSDHDYQRLLKASQGDSALNDLIKLGAHTGCRIEELCSLKLEDTTDESLSIINAKTGAGIREIPIHKDIRQLVARLMDTSTDEYLISGLTANKYGNRSNGIGKRYGRLKSELGYGREHVFHSFRNTLARKLEEAGVPENIAARTIGHEFNTMTYGLYSGGVSLKVKQEAIDQVSYI